MEVRGRRRKKKEKKKNGRTALWAEEEKKKYKKDEMDISDYGSFSGKYINVGKSDYLGESGYKGMKKKGYM